VSNFEQTTRNSFVILLPSAKGKNRVAPSISENAPLDAGRRFLPLAGRLSGARTALLACAASTNARTGGLVTLSTLQTAVSCSILLFAVHLNASHALTLTLSPVEIQADNTLRLKLFLNAPSNSAPAGLQWTFKLPPGLDILGTEAGKATKKAGKTLVCNGAKCLVFGLNRTTISNGPIAVLKIKVDPSLAGGKRPTQFKYHAHDGAREPDIQVADVMAVSLDAETIPVGPTTLRPIR
jgi:hypothetical protein